MACTAPVLTRTLSVTHVTCSAAERRKRQVGVSPSASGLISEAQPSPPTYTTAIAVDCKHTAASDMFRGDHNVGIAV